MGNFLNFLEDFEFGGEGVARLEGNVLEVDENLLNWDIFGAAKFQFNLHAFDENFIHLFILCVELYFLVVDTVEEIFYI